MIVSPDALRKELVNLLGQIDLQVKEVKQAAVEMNCLPEEVRDADGNWPMIPLLAAQVQAVSALAMLNQQKGK